MNYCCDIQRVGRYDRGRFGGKAVTLAELARKGFRLPRTLCIGADAYRCFVDSGGLRERILLELHRKQFGDMRWEEIWDAALRVRNFFLRNPFPPELTKELKLAVLESFDDHPVVVRSSAIEDDVGHVSFAGLHDSFLNVRGADRILEHIRLVWASLWSDRALLYRQELGLDIEWSAMAVLVQEMVDGDRSGVALSQDPTDAERAAVEAVYGLNEGLVDGTVEPDRWQLDRQTGRILSHRPPSARTHAVRLGDSGTALQPLSAAMAGTAPLNSAQTDRVWRLAQQAEEQFGGPRGVEWAYRKHELFALQCRLVTGSAPEDERSWYLGLHRSYENLCELHRQIQDELIPQMSAVAACFDAVALEGLSDVALAAELRCRALAVDHWRQIYRKAFIPFAHGVRLFAQLYNDAVKPENPYEFLALLAAADLWSVRRNEALLAMARLAKSEPGTLAALETRKLERTTPEFQAANKAFMDEFGCMFEWAGVGEAPEHQLAGLLREMGGAALPSRTVGPPPQELENAFLAHFSPADAAHARELLHLARASYRLRDDDNLHLGQIEAQSAKALRLARARLRESLGDQVERLPDEVLPLALREPSTAPSLLIARRERTAAAAARPGSAAFAARQLVGQPAGPGLVSGIARVITRREQFFSFRRGEVLVCDAIDPNITFVVPLAVAVVERRGGMLIHGAMVAREYGLPCVTGVPDATRAIPDGARVTVDGHLGLVTVDTTPPTAS